MNAQPSTVSPPPAASGPQLRTLVLCDLADSTALVERLGDQRAADLMRKHDRVARDLVHAHAGREIDKTDGFLVMFERPIQAVAFALDYQRDLKALGESEKILLRARAGIHVGEVVQWDNVADDIAQGAKPIEVEGLVKPIAARLASLALPGQILTSSVTASLAQRGHAELGDRAARTRWISHGRFRFKGVPEPVPVHEVGEEGIAPFRIPPWSSKAHREVPWWRRPSTMAIESLVALGAIGGIAYFSLRAPAAIAFAQRDWVVVGDLQNLTGQPVFDDSLQVAFRIGLEQSRYVNVVSDLQVRETIRRMALDPTKTPLDRGAAAEVALREGAKAVILPTIAEVGGRVQVSAEIIDPKSQQTVYSEAIDGKGVESVLPATDALLRELRARLGESLASINESALPLEKVTTANLDALRAYSLATRALGEGKGAESISLFERASELDHDFALAYLGLSNVYYTTGQKAKAKAYALKAGERVDRLSARERLTTEGYISLFATPAAMKEKWSLLAKLYPDALSGQNNLAFALWWYDNDLDEAARYFGEVARSRHPRRGYAWLLLGDIQTAEGRWEQARASYRTARQVGSPQLYLNPVHLDIALGDDAAATRTLAAEPTNGFPFFEVEKSLRGASLHVQHGRLARALDATRAAQRAASKAGLDNSLHRARLAEIAVSYALGSSEAPKLLRALVDDEIARLAKSTGPYDQGSYVHLTLAAMLALRHDDAALAERALDALEPKVEGSGYFSLEQPYQVARCESGLASDAAAAVACLEQARSPHAYYQTNVALLRAYSAAGKTEQARATAGTLIEQRARGIIEYLGEFAAQVPNLIDADEALVARAAIDADAGRADAAQADLTRFLDAWRDGDTDAPLRRRALALQERLRSQQEKR